MKAQASSRGTTRYWIGLTAEERVSKAEVDQPKLKDLRSRILHLGLDLLGGMHVVLEADIEQAADSRILKRLQTTAPEI